MLASILKAFAMDSGPDVRLDSPRSVDLSGNILTFAMPGNFSRDMPADDLITQVDIQSDNFVKRKGNKTLIRRWWDVKAPGLFGKELGVVMMSISIEPLPTSHRQLIDLEDLDSRNRFDFIMLLSEHLHQKYKGINNEVEGDTPGEPAYFYSSFAKIGETIEAYFWDDIFNGQLWTRYGAGGPHDQLSNHYVIPVSDRAFIEVAFTFSPNQGIESPRQFLEAGRRMTDPILRSLEIEYTPNNPYRVLVEEEWQREGVQDVMQRHQQQLAPLFDSDGPSTLGPEDLKGLEGADQR